VSVCLLQSVKQSASSLWGKSVQWMSRWKVESWDWKVIVGAFELFGWLSEFLVLGCRCGRSEHFGSNFSRDFRVLSCGWTEIRQISSMKRAGWFEIPRKEQRKHSPTSQINAWTPNTCDNHKHLHAWTAPRHQNSNESIVVNNTLRISCGWRGKLNQQQKMTLPTEYRCVER
jgi:hypothetical protein